MKAILLAAVLATVSVAASARDLSVTGQLGFLSEWELAAHLREDGSGSRAEFNGPLKLRHTGLCTANGPVEKLGDMHVRHAGMFGARLEATLSFDGKQCAFTARGSKTYDGVLKCPGSDIPLRLRLE